MNNLLNLFSSLGELPIGLRAAAAIVCLLLACLIAKMIFKLLGRLAKPSLAFFSIASSSKIVAKFEKLLFWIAIAGSAAGLSHLFNLPTPVNKALNGAFAVVLIISAGIAASALIQANIERSIRGSAADDRSSLSALGLIRFLVTLVLWSLVVLLLLDNFGVSISALVTGLGIGGVAVALAVQSILGDLFASLSIVLDKPFVVGDYIVIGELRGTVENIGIKTTRLRSINGEQLVLSNSDLLSSRIQNFNRMRERRVLFTLGVTYQTDLIKIAQLPAELKKIVESHSPVRFDRAHFKTLGDFALIFEIVYFVLSSEFVVYMDIQQSINLQIMQRLKEMGVEVAYPTQTIFLEKNRSDSLVA